MHTCEVEIPKGTVDGGDLLLDIMPPTVDTKDDTKEQDKLMIYRI